MADTKIPKKVLDAFQTMKVIVLEHPTKVEADLGDYEVLSMEPKGDAIAKSFYLKKKSGRGAVRISGSHWLKHKEIQLPSLKAAAKAITELKSLEHKLASLTKK